MSINFNIVKKPNKKEETTEEEVVEELEDEEIEEDLEEEKTSSITFDPKKKMIKFMGIILIIMFVIILILFIASSLGKKTKTYSYSEIETVLTKAAKSYFKDHSNYLPKDDGDVVEVDHTNLVAEGKMKDLSYYTKKGVTCSAVVRVEKDGKEYNYTPDLNCGDAYSSVPLYEKVIKDNTPVTSGYGLYSMNNGYVFRGELVDNYVLIGDIVWRIVKINSNNNIMLISEEAINYSRTWDNRYNEDTKYDSGKNTYSSSRIRESLEELYKGTLKNTDGYELTSAVKSKTISFNLCTGKRDINSEGKDNSQECLETLPNQKVGLLTVSDYMMASIDPNCKSINSKSCKNYNYLHYRRDWWLVTASKSSTYKAFIVRSGGVVREEETAKYGYIRPVVYLDTDVMYKSGKGTIKSPYKVR